MNPWCPTCDEWVGDSNACIRCLAEAAEQSRRFKEKPRDSGYITQDRLQGFLGNLDSLAAHRRLDMALADEQRRSADLEYMRSMVGEQWPADTAMPCAFFAKEGEFYYVNIYGELACLRRENGK